MLADPRICRQTMEHKGLYLPLLHRAECLFTDMPHFVRLFHTSQETMQYEYGSLGQYVLSNMDGATAPWMRYRLMVVGKDRVGKTSLLKSLRRERFNKREQSTQVADVNQVRMEDV